MEGVAVKENAHSPDDIVAALYLYAGAVDFTSDKEIIHSTLNRLFEKYSRQFSDLKELFTFCSDESYPFSKEVEGILIRLQISNVIIAENPTYNKYRVNLDISRDIISEIEEYLSPPEITLLKTISKEFAEVCKVD
jgi:hypothetical protein